MNFIDFTFLKIINCIIIKFVEITVFQQIEIMMHCTLCENPLENKVDDFYFHCNVCDAYVKDSKFYINYQQEKKRYEAHNNDVNDAGYQKFTSPITNFILQNYSPNHLGLDFGCGKGPVISEQLQKHGFQIKLYDPFFYPDENYLNFKYDYIFSCEVFEHFHHPKNEIDKLLHLLKTSGKLLVMTHLYDGEIAFSNWYYRNDPTHVFIYTSNTFAYIATKYQLNLGFQNNRFIILQK
ncbi:class I SAM-dependent methyltransferase [Polaribacter sp.]|uniref:class I SAM-dependent methyltransferase n=2 Tax=Polaribacter sp. TaxID=1920175 RepID=UPI004047C274